MSSFKWTVIKHLIVSTSHRRLDTTRQLRTSLPSTLQPSRHRPREDLLPPIVGPASRDSQSLARMPSITKTTSQVTWQRNRLRPWTMVGEMTKAPLMHSNCNMAPKHKNQIIRARNTLSITAPISCIKTLKKDTLTNSTKVGTQALAKPPSPLPSTTLITLQSLSNRWSRIWISDT